MANRNVRLMIDDRVFLIRVSETSSRKDFIELIGRILKSSGGPVNADDSKNIKFVIGDRGDGRYQEEFKFCSPYPNESGENFIERLIEELTYRVGPVINVVDPVINVEPSAECRTAFECPVCMRQYSNDIQPTTLPCGHSLCMTDAARVSSICPICRSPFVLVNQRLSVSLRDASVTCAPEPHAGGLKRRRCQATRRRRRSNRRKQNECGGGTKNKTSKHKYKK
jgi:hypothetical protein